MLDPETALRVLREGQIEIVGRIVGSSNNAMLATVSVPCPEPEPALSMHAIYKPTAGERPLDDFPDGTLSRREVAAWHVSEALGWGVVPPKSVPVSRRVWNAWDRSARAAWLSPRLSRTVERSSVA